MMKFLKTMIAVLLFAVMLAGGSVAMAFANGDSVRVAASATTESGISVPPVQVLPVLSLSQLNDLAKSEEKPDVCILEINENLDVIDAIGAVIKPLGDALIDLADIVPAYKVSSKAVADKLSAYLNPRKLNDSYILSSDMTIIKAFRDVCIKNYAIADFTETTISDKSDLLAIRDAANSAGAKVVLLNAQNATKDNVEWLQKRLMTVWSTAEGDDIFTSILHGVNGVLTQDMTRFNTELAGFNDDFSMVRKQFIIGHRGMPSKEKENTLESAIAAVEAGADAVENDIHLTKDNRIVIMHDGVLQTTTDGTGAIADMTLEQIQSYKVVKGNGVTPRAIPTLDDFFATFKDKDMMHYVEIKSKDPKIIPALKALIAEYGVSDQVVVISFLDAQLKLVREQIPELSVGLLADFKKSTTVEATVKDYARSTAVLNATLHPSYADVSSEFILQSAARGMGVYTWTYRQALAFQEAYSMGIYGLTTDDSYWASNYAVRLNAENIVVGLDQETARPLKANIVTQVGETKEVKCQIFKVLEGDSSKFKENSDGLWYGEASSMKVVLKYSFKERGVAYAIYSEPVTITAQKIEIPVASEKKGCGGNMNATALVAIICLGAFMAVKLVAKKKKIF